MNRYYYSRPIFEKFENIKENIKSKNIIFLGTLEFLDSGRKCWTLESGLWTLGPRCWALGSRQWTLLLTGEPSFCFCLIELLKILWVRFSKDLMVTLILQRVCSKPAEKISIMRNWIRSEEAILNFQKQPSRATKISKENTTDRVLLEKLQTDSPEQPFQSKMAPPRMFSRKSFEIFQSTQILQFVEVNSCQWNR